MKFHQNNLLKKWNIKISYKEAMLYYFFIYLERFILFVSNVVLYVNMASRLRNGKNILKKLIIFRQYFLRLYFSDVSAAFNTLLN